MCPAFILGHHIALSGITRVHVHVQNLLFCLLRRTVTIIMSPLVLNCSICACLHCCGLSLKTMHRCSLSFHWSYVPAFKALSLHYFYSLLTSYSFCQDQLWLSCLNQWHSRKVLLGNWMLSFKCVIAMIIVPNYT